MIAAAVASSATEPAADDAEEGEDLNQLETGEEETAETDEPVAWSMVWWCLMYVSSLNWLN